MRFKPAFLTTLFLVSVAFQAHSQSNASSPEGNTVGQVDFPISCSPKAQKLFNRGVALLHNMQYVEAEKTFLAVAGADPNCAMAHWGVAMAYMRPLWLDPGTYAEHHKRGKQAVERARALNTGSAREKAYLAAVSSFYDSEDSGTQLRGWETGMEAVHRAYPDDTEATVFYALSHLAVAPSDLAHREKAGEILEAVFAKHPRHPGAIHYLIHSYDDPVLAPRGVKAARAYGKIAPEAPHALHMPSHIFVRLGMWEDCIASNQRSAQAALRLPKVDGLVPNHYPHAMDYLVYGLLQRAQDKEVEAALSEFRSNGGYEKEIGSAYALAAIPARYALERHRWAEASRLVVRDPQSFPWEEYPEIEAMSWHARGLGAAHSGETDQAKKAIAALDRLYERMRERATTECDWATTIDAQRKTVAAWVALDEKRRVAARKLMEEAVVLENSKRACAMTGWIMTLPAQELLGDLLLEMDDAAEALRAYEASLRTTPNRFNSLYGAGRALERLGDNAKAKWYYGKLLKMADPTATERPGVKRAKQFLQEN